MLKLRSTESAATSQPYRVEPELRSLNVPLKVDVRWLVAICRVEEEPVWALPMDRWHKISVSLCASLDSRPPGSSSPCRRTFGSRSCFPTCRRIDRRRSRRWPFSDAELGSNEFLDGIATAHFQHRLRAYRPGSHGDRHERTADPFLGREFLQVLRDDRDRVHVKRIAVGQLDESRP